MRSEITAYVAEHGVSARTAFRRLAGVPARPPGRPPAKTPLGRLLSTAGLPRLEVARRLDVSLRTLERWVAQDEPDPALVARVTEIVTR